jgi:prevent-host-death family protein
MKVVKIAELKAKLSSYLKDVLNGEDVVIYDRNLPVAKIIPFEKMATLKIIPPKSTWAKAWSSACVLREREDAKLNLLESLLSMREEDR